METQGKRKLSHDFTTNETEHTNYTNYYTVYISPTYKQWQLRDKIALQKELWFLTFLACDPLK